MRKILLLLTSLFLFTQTMLHAQPYRLQGHVVNTSGKPIQGVSIALKGTKKGTVSDADGAFAIIIDTNVVLEVSSLGYSPQEVSLEGRATITITLEENVTELGQIVLIGTRRAGRVKTETPVPVDVINVSTPQPTSRSDLTSLLNFTAPSFNYNKQSGSDGADHVDLATLRGLGPDQTLVLINGKRRHQTSFVSVFGTRGRGNSGTDLNAIPISAIDRVEILRDGASAQYGSDAIAGVINIILKKTVGKLTGNISGAAYDDPKFNTAFKNGMGQYEYDHKLDGRTFTVGLNYGLPLGKKGGFINLSGDYFTNSKTYRQALDTSDPIHNTNGMIINPYRRANGDGSLEMVGGMMNMEVPISASNIRFYSFGGYNYRSSDAFAFTRDYSAHPERFPTDANGNLIEVPGIIKTTSDGIKYFNPHIQTKIRDISLAAGVKGITKKGWTWDLSNTIGENRFQFFGDKTFNASLGADKTHFDDGGFTFLQNTSNFDWSKELKGIAQGFNIAFGTEFRYERYTIFAGEPNSYENYDTLKASGSQGFPGYQPSDVVNANRTTVGLYVDGELDITKNWLVDGAIRLENYSDFGFTDNYKLATRVKASDHLNFRGSISTGFRAPSLQQINYSSTFTTVQGGLIAEVRIAPNYSTLAKAAGIPELKQEHSVNASLGFTYTPIRQLNITVDGYWIHIKDRVVLSGQFDATDPDIDPELGAKMNALNVSYAQFFANAVNTTNKGIDIVMDYNRRWSDKHVRFLLAGNIQEMNIDDINVPTKLAGSEHLRQTFLSDREQAFILASAPKSKFTLNLEYGLKKWTWGGRLTYFGKVVLLGYGADGLGIDPKVPTDLDPSISVRDQYDYTGKFVTDLYTTYSFNKQFTLQIGVDNLFNVHPDLGVASGAKEWAYNNEPAGPFDAVQMGGDGRHFFARLSFAF